MENWKKIVVIVAGGSGQRMNNELPKQFMALDRTPILIRTLNCFLQYDHEIEIRLVLPESHFSHWEKISGQVVPKIPIKLISGGETRFHSVKNGIQNISHNSLVAIHDGVRPLVSQQTIANCFNLASTKGSVIPVMELTESIREIIGEKSVSKSRANYRLVQTPQVFRADWLTEAYQVNYMENFTDDASVMEQAGFPIFLAPGNDENIKITTPKDLKLAELLLNNFLG